jgi:hypothetical protein
MNIYQKELENEISRLNIRISEQRKTFDHGLKEDKPLSELKPIYAQIKEMEKRLEFCFEESRAMREQG